jgi:hypothetical protein
MLQPDGDFVYVDQYHDSTQLSQYPMLPLLAAADAIHNQEATPPVDWPAVDVIADRNSLRTLLRWLNLSLSPGREVRDFRINIQLVGDKTLMLCHWKTPQERST